MPTLVSNAQSQPHSPEPNGAGLWRDADLAAALIAVLGHAGGGVRVIAQPGPVRDFWLENLNSRIDQSARRVPGATPTERLIGGMDITESMRLGKPVLAQGVFAECHNRHIVLPMAERLPKEFTGHWCAAMDTGAVKVARDGLSQTSNAMITVIALDEGIDEETPPAALLERLSLTINLDEISIRCVDEPLFSRGDIKHAQERMDTVALDDTTLLLLTQLAASMGIHSIRVLRFAVIACKALTLLLETSETDDAVIHPIIRLIFLPRATHIPAPPEEPEPPEDTPPLPEESQQPDSAQQQGEHQEADETVQSAIAELPTDLLATLLKRAERSRMRQNKAGNSGQIAQDKQRGRPIGVRRGELKRGHRIDIPATLRAAAPFQAVRARWDTSNHQQASLYIEPQDIRVKRFEQRKSSVMIFAVDASGSSAHQRMAEAKGAIELLLADCYSHRTEVALISFKGESADLLLPPTRSLVRAKRTLAQLPGGGGTPMAAALQTIYDLATTVEATGATPTYVLLTDGASNVARDGTKSRAAGTEDALRVAKKVAATHYRGVLVDTAVRPSPRARELSSALDATYLPLPNASAQSINASIRALNEE